MIIAYSNPSSITYEKLSEFYEADYSLKCEMIFCGGLSYSDFKDTFKILMTFKKKNPEKFKILLSSYDVSFINTIIELYKFISFSEDILKDYTNNNKSTLKKPKNILSFKSEYKDVIDINKILTEDNVFLSKDEMKKLYELINMLKKYNTFDIDEIIFLVSNSQIVYENEDFIFTAENGSLNYESFEELNAKFLEGFDNVINCRYSKFIKTYSRKQKKINYPKLQKTYVVGDNIKHFDQPYYRADKNIIFLNSRCGRREKNIYLDDADYINKKAHSYIKIEDGNVTVVCENSKKERLEGPLKFERAFEIEQIEGFKNYAIEVLNYVAIPIRGTQTFAIATKDQVQKVAYTISSLVEEDFEEDFQETMGERISDLIERTRPILKISDFLQESDSIVSEKPIKLNEIFDESDSISSKKKVSFGEEIISRADSSDGSEIDEYMETLKSKE